MEEKMTMKALRRELAPMSRSLLIYYLMMNLVVSLVVGIDATLRLMWFREYNSLGQALQDAVSTNYWGYLLTIVIGLAIVLSWKGTDFWRKEIWKPNRAMTLSTFLLLLTWLFGSQTLLSLVNGALDWLLQHWGLSTQNALEAATSVPDSPSMFLYACLVAPIAEELLFRGLILRGFLPHGKKFAVIASAVLFGLYHGNLVQSPFAFFVGLIFGYAAVEYNIAWAMVLHLSNNLLLGDTLYRVLNVLNPLFAVLLESGLTSALMICWIVVTLLKRHSMIAWIRQEKMDWRAFGAMFQCPSTIILVIITVASMVMSVL